MFHLMHADHSGETDMAAAEGTRSGQRVLCSK